MLRTLVALVLGSLALAACTDTTRNQPACDPRPGSQCGGVFVPQSQPTGTTPAAWPPPQK